MCVNRSISRTHLFMMHYRWLSSNYLRIAIWRLWCLLLWWYFELLFWWFWITLKHFKVMLCSTYKSSLVLIHVLSIQIGGFLFTDQKFSEHFVPDNLISILTYVSCSFSWPANLVIQNLGLIALLTLFILLSYYFFFFFNYAQKPFKVFQE